MLQPNALGNATVSTCAATNEEHDCGHVFWPERLATRHHSLPPKPKGLTIRNHAGKNRHIEVLRPDDNQYGQHLAVAMPINIGDILLSIDKLWNCKNENNY